MSTWTIDTIPYEEARTLDGLFLERLKRTPEAIAYRAYDEKNDRWVDYTWQQTSEALSRWRAAFEKESLNPGDRVALMLRNCREWVLFDQAAHQLGLVVIPLYPNDRAENVAYILNDAGVKLMLIEDDEHWEHLRDVRHEMKTVERIIFMEDTQTTITDPRVVEASEWLPEIGSELSASGTDPDKLATIVYTSGTTGRPKGVMLSHKNILWNAWSGLQNIAVYREDLFLSFLPLSHTLERSIGYYLAMMAGSTVAYARSIPQLGEDLMNVKPTVIVSVPRIFERVHSRINTGLEEKSIIARGLFKLAVHVGWKRFLSQQHRGMPSIFGFLWPLLDKIIASKIKEKLGGRIRFAICGGAALAPDIAKLFIGLGIKIQQGYGLTETSPVLTVNPIENNIPASVGTLLKDVEAKIGENDELVVRSPGIMIGYWNNHKATAEMIDADGWLHTGDKVRIEDDHVFITGRLKEIIVLANGEKVPPSDMEGAISMDVLFDQVMVIGEGKPYLAAFIVLNPDQWEITAKSLGVDATAPESLTSEKVQERICQRIGKQLNSFPGYAQVRRVLLTLDPWTVDSGLMTPTLKIKRTKIIEKYHDQLENLYKGH